ncbi:MAG TPA: ribokinase [Edaphobacter sp.]
MGRKPIVVVGSLNLDLVVHAERVPLQGETVAGSGYDESLGGKGANQAVAAAKLGAQVRMVGKVGSDGYGQRLLEGVSSSGVDVSAVSVEEGPSGLAVITHASDGANTIVVIPGANEQLDVPSLEKAADAIREASILLLQLETPMDTVIRAAEIAREAGVSVVLDPTPAQDLPAELISLATWITPNETEAARLIHQSEELPPESIAEKLIAMGTRNVVLKRGEHGCYVKRQDYAAGVHVPAFVSQAIDTTAAGDCFNGAFATRLAAGDSPEVAALYANAAASISVTRHGAQASMPTASEVEALLKSE